RLSHRNDPTIRRLERGHRTDCRSLTHTTDTQPTQPLHAPIPLSPSQVAAPSPLRAGHRVQRFKLFLDYLMVPVGPVLY
ncbi:MAG TPA: hypothetical protein VLZ05_01185, partial [Mycobacterium sp.]